MIGVDNPDINNYVNYKIATAPMSVNQRNKAHLEWKGVHKPPFEHLEAMNDTPGNIVTAVVVGKGEHVVAAKRKKRKVEII